VQPFRIITIFAALTLNNSDMTNEDLKWVVEDLKEEISQLKETIENLHLLIADLTKALKKK
jgi:hypothetical protein